MVVAPEPHRDQQTIASFKRTLNAALLLLVDGHRRRPVKTGTTRTLAILLALAVGAKTSHDPHWLLDLLP